MIGAFFGAFLIILAHVPAVYAGCLNCNIAPREETTQEEEAAEEREYDIPSSGSLRTKLRRLPDDSVEHLVVPVLFGVSTKDITSNFGDPRDGGSRSHEGLDILAPLGTPIISPTVAVVTGRGTWTGAGKYIQTANPGDERFVYMHLDAFADIREGDELQVGDLIGYVGDTGNARGGPAHLHLEIREGRRATDPYPRITRNLSPEKKIAYLDDILDKEDDAADLAAFLVETFSSVFIQAQYAGLELPRRIERLMPDLLDIRRTDAPDLEVGDVGEYVSALQSILIAEGHLAIDEPTGVFGPLTKQALVIYQEALGIVPATGYFGPLTRAAMRQENLDIAIPAQTDELDLASIVELFLALGLIDPEKEEAAYKAIAAL
jgi:hypothetical protein